MTNLHTHFTTGKRLRMVLRNGEVHEVKFVETRSKWVVVLKDGVETRVNTSELKSMTIWRK